MRMAIVVAIFTVVPRIGAAAPDDRDETVAIGLSVGGTVASAAVFAVSAIEYQQNFFSDSNAGLALLGAGVLAIALPSAGEWYAGRAVTWGMALRAVGSTAAVLGVLLKDPSCEGSGCAGNNNLPTAVLVPGVAIFAAGAIYDIATAPRAVRRYTAKQHATVAPTVLHPPSGPVMGVGIGGAF